VGGLNEFFYILLTFFITRFADRRQVGILAEHLYTSSSEGGFGAQKIKNIPNQDFWLCINCFCCKAGWYKKYENKLELVENDLLKQLDLIHFLKRIRMHGKALSYKLN
jgi:hypothetical protein